MANTGRCISAAPSKHRSMRPIDSGNDPRHAEAKRGSVCGTTSGGHCENVPHRRRGVHILGHPQARASYRTRHPRQAAGIRLADVGITHITVLPSPAKEGPGSPGRANGQAVSACASGVLGDGSERAHSRRGFAVRFGSVCSGIEAASAAWEPLGWKGAWLSEIEPFACAALTPAA